MIFDLSVNRVFTGHDESQSELWLVLLKNQREDHSVFYFGTFFGIFTNAVLLCHVD